MSLSEPLSRPEVTELPTYEHLQLIAHAILCVGVQYGEGIAYSSQDGTMLVRKELEGGFTDSWAWPIVSRGLLAILRDTPKGVSVSVEITEQIHRSDIDMAAVKHTYELESIGYDMVSFGHGIRVQPQIPEHLDPYFGSIVEFAQAGEGAKKIEQDFGGNQELRAADCDYLFDQITSFW